MKRILVYIVTEIHIIAEMARQCSLPTQPTRQITILQGLFTPE